MRRERSWSRIGTAMDVSPHPGSAAVFAGTAPTTIKVHFGTNHAETAKPELFGPAFRVPSDPDKRLYVTGPILVRRSGDIFTIDVASLVLDPPPPTNTGEIT